MIEINYVKPNAGKQKTNIGRLKTWCNHIPSVKVASRYCQKKCTHFIWIDEDRNIVYCDRDKS